MLIYEGEYDLTVLREESQINVLASTKYLGIAPD